MISTKKLIKLARKWQRFVAIRRGRISYPRTDMDGDAGSSSSISTASKGHFVVYSADHKRFELPIVYLNNSIIRELLTMSEEEFGLATDGPITIPCDSSFMEYIISLMQKQAGQDLEKTLVMFLSSSRCSISQSVDQTQFQSQSLVCSF